MTETLTSTPPSEDWLLELDDDEEDDELLLGIEGIEGCPDEELLGIDGIEGEDEEEGEALGMEGAEGADGDDELGIEGMELLELLELEVVSQAASNTARAETVSSALNEVCVTGVFMLLSSSRCHSVRNWYATRKCLVPQVPGTGLAIV